MATIDFGDGVCGSATYSNTPYYTTTTSGSFTWNPSYPSTTGSGTTIYDSWTGPYKSTGTMVPVTAEILGDVLRDYRDEITRQIFEPSPLLDYVKKNHNRKEKTVADQVRSVVEKRREKKIEKLVDRFSEWVGEDSPVQTMALLWDVTFKTNPDKVYRYAAVQDEVGNWYVTNRRETLSSDAMLTLLVEQALDGVVDNVRWG